MIKICSPQLGMSQNSSLGGEVYDYQTIKGFTKKGFKVFVYLPKNRVYDKTLKNLKIDFCAIQHVIPPWIYSFLVLPYLFRLYKKESFNVLRIHSPRFLGIGAFIFHLLHPQALLVSNGITVDDSEFFYPIEKWVYKNSKAIIVQSEYMKKRIKQRYSLNGKNIFVTYGGLLNQIIKVKIPAEASLVKKENKAILFMGVLIPRKNPMFALEVFAKIKSKIPQSKFIIIGNGPEKNKLKEFVENQKLKDEVIFIDKAYEGEKAYWFKRMDLVLFPSLDEGFGLVATEAMSFKKVVITSNKAAFPEIINNGQDGFCLELDQNNWVKVAIKILKDKNLSEEIGNRAYKKVKSEFSWERMYNLNAQVIKNLR